MELFSKVYVILDGQIREGNYRGKNQHCNHLCASWSDAESRNSVAPLREATGEHGVWMTAEATGQNRFYEFKFSEDEIYDDIEDAKKALFMRKLAGTA